MDVVLAIIFSVIILALIVLQICLIAGAPLGQVSWGGQYKILPPKLRVAAAISILILLFFAATVLSKAGVWTLVSQPLLDIGMWIVVIYTLFSVFMNGISRSKPERYLMTPTSLVLGVLALWVMVSA